MNMSSVNTDVGAADGGGVTLAVWLADWPLYCAPYKAGDSCVEHYNVISPAQPPTIVSQHSVLHSLFIFILIVIVFLSSPRK